jgi:hypothetical protein
MNQGYNSTLDSALVVVVVVVAVVVAAAALVKQQNLQLSLLLVGHG